MYSEALMLIGAVVALIVLFALMLEILHIYGIYRVLYGLDWERQELRCSETGRLTSVQIGAGNAAILILFRESKIRIKSCANWPEKKNCTQKCLEGPLFPYRRAA